MTMRVIAALLAVSILALAVSCTTNEATGKSILNFISVDQEIRLGQEAAPQFLNEYGGSVKNDALVQYVRQLGLKIARSSERSDLPWEVHVPDSMVLNAFALPGGKVFVTRGMLAKLDNEAQLAGVLGHEVGHVTAQHVNQRMSQAILVQAGAAGVGVAGDIADSDLLRVLGAGTSVGGGVYLLKFSRDQESEADMLGVRYMTAHGYNPYGQVQVMKVLSEASQGGAPPEFLSTHPYPETRIERLTALIESKYPGANDPAKYTFAAERYNKRVTQVLKQLPAPRQPKNQGQATDDLDAAALALRDSGTWCGVCRHTHGDAAH